MIGDLAHFHMLCFYGEFGIKDNSIWVDLSFDEADELLKTMVASHDT